MLSNPASGITFLDPEEVVGAGSSIEDLQHRFPSDDLRDPIIHDNSEQDSQLRKLIKQHRLQHWFEACQEEAKKMLEDEAEAKHEEENAVEHMQASLAEQADLKAVPVKKAGRSTRSNGRMTRQSDDSSGGADEENEVDGDRDGDGDVEMFE